MATTTRTYTRVVGIQKLSFEREADGGPHRATVNLSMMVMESSEEKLAEMLPRLINAGILERLFEHALKGHKVESCSECVADGISGER